MANQSKNEKDPVCGMKVDSNQSSYHCDYHNKSYTFCCEQCLNKFKKNPSQFAS